MRAGVFIFAVFSMCSAIAPAAAQAPASAAPASQPAPLKSLEGLSDAEIAEIYLTDPQRLPRDLTEAELAAIHEMVQRRQAQRAP